MALQREDRFSLFVEKNPHNISVFFPSHIYLRFSFDKDFVEGQRLFWEPYNQSERFHSPYWFPLLNCASVWLCQAKQGPPGGRKMLLHCF